MPSELPQFNIRMDDTTHQMLKALCERYGLTQAGMVKMLIRDRVADLKVKEGFDHRKKLGAR